MVPKKLFSILIILPALTFFACARGPNSPTGNWGNMMGYGYGGGFMWLIVLVLVGVGIYFGTMNEKKAATHWRC